MPEKEPAMYDIARMQRELQARGLNPGPVDGVMGGLTKAALQAFEVRVGLAADGVPDPAVWERLFPIRPAEPRETPVKPTAFLPWMAEAELQLGRHEVRDYGFLARWLKSDGKTLGDPRKLPWCGDLVETCIHLHLPNEPRLSNPYGARNWMTFGQKVEPGYGAVLVFWRTHPTKSWNGHVGFYAGEGTVRGVPSFFVLGGNQSNAVTRSWLAKDRLLGARWPKTFAYPGRLIVRVDAGGAVLSRNEA
jgi:uncharacterized protein (TIGR02594 family)